MAAPWPEPGTCLELRRQPSPRRGRCSERTAWALTSSAGGRQGLEHGRFGVSAQRTEPPDVAGEQVVVGDAPVFGRSSGPGAKLHAQRPHPGTAADADAR